MTNVVEAASLSTQHSSPSPAPASFGSAVKKRGPYSLSAGDVSESDSDSSDSDIEDWAKGGTPIGSQKDARKAAASEAIGVKGQEGSGVIAGRVKSRGIGNGSASNSDNDSDDESGEDGTWALLLLLSLRCPQRSSEGSFGAHAWTI